MRVFIGDTMITNGHSLFDNGQIRDGYILHLEQHLDRFFRGTKSIHLKESNLGESLTRDKIRELIVEAVARSGVRNGSYRYYLTAGLHGKQSQAMFHLIVENGIPVKPLEGCDEV